jgi:hypothetical protein
MELSYIDIIRYIFFLLGCLLLFTVMYDHCVNNMSWSSAFKKRIVAFLSPSITVVLFIIVVVLSILGLIYALMHNSSLF